MVRRSLMAAVACVLLAAAPASAAPPANDAPSAAADFAPYTAPNGTPGDEQALADLSAATPDAGVPRCLGRRSFQRTVWYRVPAADVARRVTVEAAGYTAAMLDIAAFVQPETGSNTRRPNQCDDGSTPDGTPAVTLFVPPGRPLLVQVGGRGSAGAAVQQTLITLSTADLAPRSAPAGDVATTAPAAGARSSLVLSGATLTDEDPAEPACAASGTVWRRYVPRRSGRLHVTLTGNHASTLTVFSGARPTADDALDCVNRVAGGALEMVVPARAGRPLWVRAGTEKGGRATLRLTDGTDLTVVDGGPGGVDVTPYGPAGGLPAACDDADAGLARIVARPGARTRDTLALRLSLSGSAACDVHLVLRGPGGGIFVDQRLVFLGRRTTTVRLPLARALQRGRYRLVADGLDLLGRRVRVPAQLKPPRL